MGTILEVNLDFEATLREAGEQQQALLKELQLGIQALAAATHAHVVEQAAVKLHSRRDDYLKHLILDKIADNVWAVTVQKEALWIEDGQCVVYGKSDRTKPEVLTPDGPVKITDVRIGMLVLNQHGKWTKVLKIHDNDLFDYCVETIDVEATSKIPRLFNKHDNHKGTGRRSHKPIVVRCPSCETTRETTRFKFTDGAGVSHCKKCIKKKDLVTIRISTQGQERTLTLTGSHRVLTELGWVEARDLTKKNKVYVPAWVHLPACKTKKSEAALPEVLAALIANHNEDIEMLPSPIVKIRHWRPAATTNLSRRWDITVEDGESFVCQGFVIHNSAHSMVPDMLASPKAKTAKDGSRYMIIPFSHAKAPTRQTGEAQSITSKLRAELKSRKIPYQRVERNVDGSPKTGLLHSLNLGGEQRGPTKTADGKHLNAAWSNPVLDNVRIYQKLVKSKAGVESVRRDIMTFRVVSDKHMGDKWNYPGKEGVKLLDEAQNWAYEHFSQVIFPDIMARFK